MFWLYPIFVDVDAFVEPSTFERKEEETNLEHEFYWEEQKECSPFEEHEHDAVSVSFHPIKFLDTTAKLIFVIKDRVTNEDDAVSCTTDAE